VKDDVYLHNVQAALTAKVFRLMRITKLHIENFRGFRGTHEIEFSDSNIHAIVGVNGAGKTSVLEALEIVILHIVEVILKEQDGSVYFEGEKYINIDSAKATLICSLEKFDKTTIKYDIFKNNSEIKIDAPASFNDSIFFNELPILLSYSSNRSFNIDNDDAYDFSKIPYVYKVYHEAFKESTYFNEMFAWYLKQINIQNNEKVKRQNFDYEVPTLSSVNKAVNNFLNKLQDTTLSDVGIDTSRYTGDQVLVINKPSGQIEFDQLSSGEKMVIGMVLDIAYRMSIANPQLENPLVSEGIVLIDELEQHLHPKWQMSILKALTATFPNVQFIVTTHSPLVINQLENHQLSILDDFKIIPGKEVHKVYGRDVNAIIEDFMGASHRPLDVKSLMNDIEKLLDEDNPNTERARKKLDELKAIIDPNDYEVIKLETQIVMEEDETY